MKDPVILQNQGDFALDVAIVSTKLQRWRKFEHQTMEFRLDKKTSSIYRNNSDARGICGFNGY